MKIDRLIAITMYLLNRQIVSAATLAEKFEVSKRTIQRDIDTLCMAGIPISTHFGAEGGYEILDTFQIEKGIIDIDDCSNIITALRAISSSYSVEGAEQTLEKLQAVKQFDSQKIYMDFSVTKEGIKKNNFYLIKQAIMQKNCIRLTYSNIHEQESIRVIEPLALTYKWYAWYLFAFCCEKDDYRIFKLKRIISFEILDSKHEQHHKNIDELLEQHLNNSKGEYYNILIKCKKAVRQSVKEYLNGTVEKEYNNGDFLYRMRMPMYERMWYSLLLGFGNLIEVLEPIELRERIKKHAKQIYKLY